jgi:hypothetical protein
MVTVVEKTADEVVDAVDDERLGPPDSALHPVTEMMRARASDRTDSRLGRAMSAVNACDIDA